jgi:hypothetical protein
VLFGGGGVSANYNDTWEWDGTTWTQAQPPTAPSARVWHRLAWFSLTQRVVLFGDISGTVADLWEWDGQQWTQRPTSSMPLAGGKLAYDPGRQRVLMYGAGSPPANFWMQAWDGASWSVLDRSGLVYTPGPMVWDQARSRVVMFGGNDGNDAGATWTNWTMEWDGAWALRNPPVSPPAYIDPALAYDAARQRVVLHDNSDTWTWDGTTWTKHSSSPPYRSNHAMAYDAARQRVVLFGGFGGSLAWGDTWEWDGTTWTQRIPPVSPAPRVLHLMAYDPVRQRVLLWGGFDGATTTYTDAWEWDGSTWSKLTIGGAPPPGVASAMAYHVPQQRMVLTGGAGKRTWLLGSTVLASHQTYGTGCAGAGGVPALSPFGRPTLGNQSFALDVAAAPAAAPVAHLLAVGSASFPIGPCTLLLDLTTSIALPAAANGFGFASLRVEIPGQTSLVGTMLYAQAGVLDATAPLGFTLTNGLSVLVGE